MEGTPLPSAATGTGSHVGLPIQPGPIGVIFRYDQDGGATVMKVDPTSANKDKFEEGDRILMIDGRRISMMANVNINSDKVRTLRVVKKNGLCCVETCPKNARKVDGLCSLHANGTCSYTDEEGGECTNIAVIGGLCTKHANGTCSYTDEEGGECTNIAVIGGLCTKHANGTCSYTDEEGGECPSIALTGGLCGSHGDSRRCSNRRGRLRCIRDMKSGSEGFCRVCSDGATMGDCDPLSVLFERMEEIRDTLGPFMSEHQIKVMETLHDLRKKLRNDPFQEESFSVNKLLSELVREVMQDFLADDKYQNVPLRCCDNTTFKSLTEYVHMTMLQIFKAALRDFGDGGMVYKGKFSKNDANKIIDNIIHVLRRKSCHGEDGMCIRKAGSSGTMGPTGLASSRRYDNIVYPDKVYARNEFAGLGLRIPRHKRGLSERITAIFLLGLGIGCNINLPGEAIPDTDNCATSDVYLAPSKATSIAIHLAECAIAGRGQNAPPGYMIVRESQLSPTDTTGAVTRGITEVTAPTPADSTQPNKPASHGDEEVATPTVHKTSTHSRQDESNEEEYYVEFSADCLDNDDDYVGESEGEGGRNQKSPVTVVEDLSTFGQNSKATNQLGGNGGSKSASETAVINGSAGNVNGSTRKREIPPENNNVDEIKSPPKFPRHTTTGSNRQPFNPQDYNAMAQAHLAQAHTRTVNRDFSKDDYISRVMSALRSRGESLGTIAANEHLIEFTARSRLNGSDLVPMGLSQVDSDELHLHFQRMTE